MALTGEQREHLKKALLSAFPNKAALEQMIMHKFTLTLATIAGGSNLSDKVYHLIDWFESQGHTDKLVEKAREANPGNPELRTFEEQYKRSSSTPAVAEDQQPATGKSQITQPLSREDMNRLIELLLACPSMKNRGIRDNVVASLQNNVRESITRSDQSRADVLNIVTTCNEFPGALKELNEGVRFFDKGTFCMQALDDFWNSRMK